MLRLSLALIVSFVLGSALVLPAHSQQAFTVHVNTVDTGGYPEVRATVTVVDGSQRPVTGLPQDAFKASADGQPLPVSSVASASDPGLGISVVLTFDTSGSMAGEPIAAAREAGKTLVGQLGPEDQVAIIAFSNDVRVLLPFTPDKQAAITTIDSLVAQGDTALYQAVADSAGLAASSTLPRRAVVLLSDGVDFGGVSQVDAPASLNAAQASGAPYFVVGLGETIDQAYLQQLADASGGKLVLAPTPDTLTALYQDIGSILRQQYVVTIDASDIEPGSQGALEIAVTIGGVVAAGQTALTLPAVATVAPTQPPATNPPTVVATPVPQQESGGGSGFLIPGVLLLLVAAAAGLAGVFFIRRRKPAYVVEQIEFRRIEEQPTAQLYPPIAAPEPTDPDAFLSLEGVSTETFPLGDSPVTVGFTADCAVQLPDGSTTGWERVRIWRREGRFMLHNLSRMGIVQVSGRATTWAVLEDGDQLQIGTARLIFHERSSQKLTPRMGES